MQKIIKICFFVGVLLCFFSVNEASAEKVVLWNELVPKYKLAKVQKSDTGPTLILSDSPEMITTPGVVYRDTVQEDVRIFFHHVNDTATKKILSIVVHNLDFGPVEVTFKKEGVSKPDKDWMRAGQEAQHTYFADNATAKKILPLAGTMEILSGKNGLEFAPQELITGIMDLHFSGKVELTVLMSPIGSNVFAASEYLPALPADQEPALRGTFARANRTIKIKQTKNLDKEPVVVLVADGQEDPFLWGTDAMTGKASYNCGNYGVVYEILGKVKGSGAMGFNPWGGFYAGVGIIHTAKEAKLEFIPARGASLGATGKETLLLDTPITKDFKKIVFSPPGASNLPVRLVIYKK